jgi:predicted HTH transcriptional regulator
MRNTVLCKTDFSPQILISCLNKQRIVARAKRNESIIIKNEISATFLIEQDVSNANELGNVSDTIKDTISENQNRILSLIATNSRITALELSVEVGINERNTKKSIKLLQDAGLLERKGARKNGRWIVKQPK